MKHAIHNLLNRAPIIKRIVYQALNAMNSLTGRNRRRHMARARLTMQCRDTDPLPKVANAGEIIDVNGTRVQIMHNGVMVKAGSYMSDWMSSIISDLRGHHEPQEERVFYEIMKHVGPQATMIELGAWWAYYSLWFCHDHPDRRAFMIEPLESRLNVGRENFELNKYQGTFLQGFIGGHTDSASSQFTDWDGSVHDVPKIDLQKFVKQHELTMIDILHSDIQGAELGMLQSIRPMLDQQRINYLVISTHLDRHQPCKELILDAGYHIFAEHTIRESYSEDGLIVAHSPRAPVIEEIAISHRS